MTPEYETIDCAITLLLILCADSGVRTIPLAEEKKPTELQMILPNIKGFMD